MLAAMRQQPRGNTMHVVPVSERDRSCATLEDQIESLEVLVSRARANNGELERAGAHISAALEILDRRGRIEAGAAQLPVVQGAEWAAMDAATLGAATALQEAIASVELMRLRTGVMPSHSEFRNLAHRLTQADAAFRFVAVGGRKSRSLPREPDGRRDFWRTLHDNWAALVNFLQRRPAREIL